MVTGPSRVWWALIAFATFVVANAAALAYTSQWGGNFGESKVAFVQAISLLQVALPFAGFYLLRSFFRQDSSALRNGRTILALGAAVHVGLFLTVLVGVTVAPMPAAAWVFGWSVLSSLAFLPYVGAWALARNDAWPRWASMLLALSVIVASISIVAFALRVAHAVAAEFSPTWAMLFVLLVLGFYCASLARLPLALWLGALASLATVALLLSKQIFFVGVFYGGMGPLLLFTLLVLVLSGAQYVTLSRT